MTRHRAAEDQTQQPIQPQRHHGATWIQRGRPDPFRAPGVPDRLVIVLNREGLHYVGKLTFWEYREIEVSRRGLAGEPSVKVPEMIVDASMPHHFDLHVQMSRRPTAARVVDELIQVLGSNMRRLMGLDGDPHSADLKWIHQRDVPR